VADERRQTTQRQRQEEALEYLGGCCVKCGSTERLEFDHIDPATKSFELSRFWICTWEHLLPELKKCQLLCKSCHRLKTITEDGKLGMLGGHNKVLNPKHGTAVMYALPHRCRCEDCRAWKRDYRAGRVDTLGRIRA
jgi:5-methylcytosine-specific restriction endonuclease McrA